MKIHVTGTSEIKTTQINEIVDFLNKTKGPLEFFNLDKIYQKTIDKSSSESNRSYYKGNYSFEDLNNIAKTFRRESDLNDKDILVVLTTTKILSDIVTDKNWFSFFEGNNIIVRDNNWKGCDNIKSDYIIAHQIIENIFQIISGLKLYDKYELDFHLESQSCINDFCKNELEIQYKLRTGHICKECLIKAINNGVEKNTLSQLVNTLMSIRDSISDYKSILNDYDFNYEEISISEEGIVSIGGKKIPFNYISRTLYIFFLLYKGKSFKASQLKNYVKLLESIYLHVKNTDSTKSINTLLGDESFRKNTDTLKDHRYNIKKSLNTVLGKELSDIYKIGSFSKIEGAKYSYYSQIPFKDNIKVDFSQQFLNNIRFEKFQPETN